MRLEIIIIACLIIAGPLGAIATVAGAAPLVAPGAPPFPGANPSPSAPSFPGVAQAPAGTPSDLRSYAPPLASPPLPGKTRVETRAEPVRPLHGQVCFGQAETREKIAQRRLADPVRAMRAGRAEGEALRTRLCRWKGDELLYEVYVLRRDGHVVRLYMNAQNGDALSAADATEHK